MSNTDTDNAPKQGKNEPDIAGADDRATAVDTAPEDGEVDLDDLSTDELLALSRAAESRVNVFTQLAVSNPEKHRKGLDKAKADFQKYADVLKTHNRTTSGELIDPSLVVPDKEGTAPTYADATGTFAEDAVVANMGGIGIKDSNADPEGALEKLEAQAGRNDMTDSPGTSPLMDRKTTARARREAEVMQPKSMSERTGRKRERVALDESA